jgi:hypothetical protein
MNQQCCWIILPPSQKESCFRLRNTYQGIVEKTFLPLLSGACSELSRVPPPSRSSPTHHTQRLERANLADAGGTWLATLSALCRVGHAHPHAPPLCRVGLETEKAGCSASALGRSASTPVDPPLCRLIHLRLGRSASAPGQSAFAPGRSASAPGRSATALTKPLHASHAGHLRLHARSS